MTLLDVAVLGLAVARLSRLITTDTFPPILRAREAILRRWPNADTTFGDSEVFEDGKDTLGYRIGTLRANRLAVFRTTEGWYASQPHAWSEVITCIWCASVWVAIAVWAAYWFYPVTVTLLAPFALSQIAGSFDRK